MNQIYVGRQAIYDRSLKVQAYELLYRGGAQATHTAFNGDRATLDVLFNTLIGIGLDKVAGSKPAYVNLTRAFILGEHPIPFPPERCVLEILEDIEVDDALIQGIERLKAQGFSIALDDYELKPDHERLLQIADVVKIDLLTVERPRLPHILAQLREYDVKLLAEKVETQEDFNLCLELGFEYFQGYFLCKPKVLNAQRIPGNRLSILQLLNKLQSPEASLDELVALITQNVTLSYKIMRYVNSAYLALPRQLTSVREAVLMLGQQTIRNLTALMVMNDIYDKPDELVRLSMVRAKMCELLAPDRKVQSMFFTVGLFSTLDALLDAPMSSLLESLPLAVEVKSALLERAGTAGRALEAVIHYERGEWEAAAGQLEPERLTQAYLESLDWADSLFNEVMS